MTKLPQKLLNLHPDLSYKEIRYIARTILIGRADKLRCAYILDFTVPHLGRVRSHGNKKVRRYKKGLSADKKRKQELQKLKELEKNNLLW